MDTDSFLLKNFGGIGILDGISKIRQPLAEFMALGNLDINHALNNVAYKGNLVKKWFIAR